MTTPQTTIHDCITGETITREYTASELAQLEVDNAQAIKDAETKAKAEQAAQVRKQIILDRLGITKDELQTLLG